MASTTGPLYLNNRKGGWLGGDNARNKDSHMPKPQPPPSPPATETETDTDPESPLSLLPPSTSFEQESIKTNAHAIPTTREINLPSSVQESDEPILRLDTNMEENTDANTSTETNSNAQSPIISPITSPPYWTARNSQDHPSGHGRTVSSVSAESLIPAGLGITLQDNENSSTDDRGSACWAKSVEVTDYVIVNGSTMNIGAFIVWNIRVEMLSGSTMNIRKRYSEFDDFRWRLMRTFPGFEAAVPELPPKSLISKFRPRFLEKRRAGLQYFLHCIMLNPEFSGSPVLKEFLFSG
ncbi:Phox homologous domain-containing protein [Xylaria telfairii]|nr:Phox homologous domain-containing protein [Xylaria telfairii]